MAETNGGIPSPGDPRVEKGVQKRSDLVDAWTESRHLLPKAEGAS
jgi:hypothetical protein